MIFALALIPIVIGSGAAVDFSRAYMVKSRLSHAIDQAGLAVGSSNPSSDLNDVLNRYFAANYPTEKLGVPANPVMTINDGVIEISATADVETAFLKLIGMNSITVAANSQIVRETTGLEIVLVLDNTGSMQFGGKIDALRVAAQDMVDILFEDEQNPEKLFMGLVPFVATVNIGKNMEEFVIFPDPSHEYPNFIDTEWKGCVEARVSPGDKTDDLTFSGIGPGGKWTPYFWESEDRFFFERFPNGNFTGQVFFSGCTNSWWTPDFIFSPLPTGRSGSESFATSPAGPGAFFNLDISPKDTGGPNKACPDPITPLTNSRSTLEAAIAQMEPWEGNGTMANLGAVWGWRVLSPTPPFTEGQSYDDASFNKVLVILTDGQNLISEASGGCTFTNPKYKSHYTAYGHLSDIVSDAAAGTLGTADVATAPTMLDQKLREVCENVKETGIIIYTITFQLEDTSTQDLFRDCASDPDKFFNSPNNEQLGEAFRTIGAELSNLRIAQ